MHEYKTDIYRTPAEAREGLRQYLLDATGGCALQEGSDGKLWPCGTCVLNLLEQIGLDSHEPEYGEHNDAPDRANEVWRAILQIRDANLRADTARNSQGSTGRRNKRGRHHKEVLVCKEKST